MSINLYPYSTQMKKTVWKTTYLIAFLCAVSSQPVHAQTTLDVSYTGDLLSNIDGGIETRTELISSFDVAMEHEVTGIGGNAGRFHIGGMITSGADFSGETVGDFQAVSSIDGFPDKPYLAEAWYEQTLRMKQLAY